MIEDPRSLLMNQRRWCPGFLMFDKHNSPRKIRIKTSSIRLFQNKNPAIDFPLTKNLVFFSRNYIPENVYQWSFKQSWIQLMQQEALRKHF